MLRYSFKMHLLMHPVASIPTIQYNRISMSAFSGVLGLARVVQVWAIGGIPLDTAT